MQTLGTSPSSLPRPGAKRSIASWGWSWAQTTMLSSHTAFGSSGVGLFAFSSLHHARVKPLPNETQNHAVAYPSVKHGSQLFVVDCVEILLNVDLEQTRAFHL